MITKDKSGNKSTKITIKIKNDLYYFGLHKKYCFLHKITPDEYTILGEQTPVQYIKQIESNYVKGKTNGKVL